ncbi:TetR family transcriptional regulator [Paenibacillus sp. SYP-B3998]|uniref:TetR/AcrR family transcriptional regulator n=1 Tax=Paenibacillus sp. SYP-B3998 TaxID=2678564 RepID=UPI0031F87848
MLSEAYRLFAKYGFDKTSLAMIAKEVDITKPALYYYFSSKDALFHALLQKVCKEIRFETYFPISNFSAVNFKDQFIACGLKMIQEQREHPEYSLLMKEFMIQSTRDERVMEAVKEVVDTYKNGFEVLLKHGVSLGVMGDEDIAVKAEMLTLLIDQIDNYMTLELVFDYERLWRYSVEQL